MATVARTPDAELLLRLRRRDREAWEELYAEYQPRLRAFGYRLTGTPHDADDLVQETFVRAVPRLDRLDPATAIVDRTNVVAESDETNNSASRPNSSCP